MGMLHAGGVLCAVGLLSLFVGLGRRSWMGTVGACRLLLITLVMVEDTLGDGIVGSPLCWRWHGRCCVAIVLGWLAGRSLVGRLGGGVHGLQLLATTVTSLSSSSERM